MLHVLAATTPHTFTSTGVTIAAVISAAGAVLAAVIVCVTSWRTTSYEQLLDDIEDIIADQLDNADRPRVRRRRR
jgi:formiminotetrahydrofolate cyclodeaminase